MEQLQKVCSLGPVLAERGGAPRLQANKKKKTPIKTWVKTNKVHFV